MNLCWESEQEKPKGSLLPLFFYFLSPYIGKENAAALGILWLGLLFLLSLIGGIIYLVRHDYHIRFGPSGAVVS